MATNSNDVQAALAREAARESEDQGPVCAICLEGMEWLVPAELPCECGRVCHGCHVRYFAQEVANRRPVAEIRCAGCQVLLEAAARAQAAAPAAPAAPVVVDLTADEVPPSDFVPAEHGWEESDEEEEERHGSAGHTPPYRIDPGSPTYGHQGSPRAYSPDSPPYSPTRVPGSPTYEPTAPAYMSPTALELEALQATCDRLEREKAALDQDNRAFRRLRWDLLARAEGAEREKQELSTLLTQSQTDFQGEKRRREEAEEAVEREAKRVRVCEHRLEQIAACANHYPSRSPASALKQSIASALTHPGPAEPHDSSAVVVEDE